MNYKCIFGSVSKIENEGWNIWFLSLQEATNNDVKLSEQVNKTLIRFLGKEELSHPQETSGNFVLTKAPEMLKLGKRTEIREVLWG